MGSLRFPGERIVSFISLALLGYLPSRRYCLPCSNGNTEIDMDVQILLILALIGTEWHVLMKIYLTMCKV